MTAGSGIIHQEMPRRTEGLLRGFQLWANLPQSHKMMDPRYRDVKRELIPEISLTDQIKAKIVCGQLNGTQGPVQDIVTEPEYLDISMASSAEFQHSVKTGHTVFVYVFEGAADFAPDQSQLISSGHLVIFGDGNTIKITTKDESARFLVVSGKPVGEPVAWWGPIVMNTEAELKLAFEEYREGTFLKHKQTEWPEYYRK
ncbi:MAG: pirin family protein [Candidatus Hodarchaeales archaeon]|jgi:redox-sensitive bicupin YhaK (pirin superfamily)